MRRGGVKRETRETSIVVSVALDGSGRAAIDTGVGFFDHMLEQLARHGSFDLDISGQGDLQVDAHHLAEDVGICLGRAFNEALGEPVGIARYGHAVVPMDEALGEAVVDISGRPLLVFDADFTRPQVGQLDTELVEEFWRAFAVNARVTLHLYLRRGRNAHHQVEALFKAAARALRLAVQQEGSGVPSTKGALDL